MIFYLINHFEQVCGKDSQGCVLIDNSGVITGSNLTCSQSRWWSGEDFWAYFSNFLVQTEIQICHVQMLGEHIEWIKTLILLISFIWWINALLCPRFIAKCSSYNCQMASANPAMSSIAISYDFLDYISSVDVEHSIHHCTVSLGCVIHCNDCCSEGQHSTSDVSRGQLTLVFKDGDLHW